MEPILVDAERYRENEEQYRKALEEFEQASAKYAFDKAHGTDSSLLEPAYEELKRRKEQLDQQYAALTELRLKLAAARDAIRNGALVG